MAKKTEKRGKLDTNSVGPGVRQETLKKDQDCGEKTEKRGK
uniref:YuzL family protein n=1 Tax=Trichinella nativa TaxID=6335 RepID=A0A0V1KJD6_9BILA